MMIGCSGESLPKNNDIMKDVRKVNWKIHSYLVYAWKMWCTKTRTSVSQPFLMSHPQKKTAVNKQEKPIFVVFHSTLFRSERNERVSINKCCWRLHRVRSFQIRYYCWWYSFSPPCLSLSPSLHFNVFFFLSLFFLSTLHRYSKTNIALHFTHDKWTSAYNISLLPKMFKLNKVENARMNRGA